MEPVIESSLRTRRTRQQITALIEKYKSSGLKIGEFCEHHNINKGTFHKWLSRRKQKVVATKLRRPAFAKVEVTAPDVHLFAEVNGIRLYQAVSASYLKELKG